MMLADRRAVVAIDPTTRGLAFVFFEDGKVMDWGERSSHSRRDDLEVFDQLIFECAAQVIVLEDAEAPGARRRARIRQLLRILAEHAQQRGLRVIKVPRRDVRETWALRGVTRKEAVAAAIAGAFVEMGGVVPPKRKTSSNEDPRVNLFDAASLAIYACDPGRVVP
jgi:hypothetical protein